jgi:hypothetical protein
MPYARFRGMELVPLFAAGGRSGIRLSPNSWRKLHGIRHSLLQEAACFRLRGYSGIIPAGGADSLENFCFCWHGMQLIESRIHYCSAIFVRPPRA